jgi:hypothetical protein
MRFENGAKTFCDVFFSIWENFFLCLVFVSASLLDDFTMQAAKSLISATKTSNKAILRNGTTFEQIRGAARKREKGPEHPVNPPAPFKPPANQPCITLRDGSSMPLLALGFQLSNSFSTINFTLQYLESRARKINRIDQIWIQKWNKAHRLVILHWWSKLVQCKLFLDIASVYKNEREIGRAIRESELKRDEIYITGKLWNNRHRPERVQAAIKRTLEVIISFWYQSMMIYKNFF